MIARRGFLAGAVATAAALRAQPARAQSSLGGIPASTVTIGVAGPFTGADHALGEQLANGVQQAVNEANEFHGSYELLFNTRTFDDENMLAQSLETAQLAVDDITIACIVGHLSGRVTEAALHTYNQAQLPVIIPSSSYDRLTAYGLGGVLRLPTKDSTEGSLGAKYAEDWIKPKQVVVLYEDGDYGFDVANGFANRLAADKVACQAIKISWEKPDFGAAVQQTMAANPDFVYLAGNAADMGPLLDALRAAKYTGPFGASQGFFVQAVVDTYAASAEGLIASSSIPPFQFAPADTQIIEDYEQAFGTFTSLAALGYASAQIAIDAVRRTGLAERHGLWQTFQLPATYDTIMGTLSFLSSGDQVDPNLYFYTVKDAKWTYLRSARPTGFLLK